MPLTRPSLASRALRSVGAVTSPESGLIIFLWAMVTLSSSSAVLSPAGSGGTGIGAGAAGGGVGSGEVDTGVGSGATDGMGTLGAVAVGCVEAVGSAGSVGLAGGAAKVSICACTSASSSEADWVRPSSTGSGAGVASAESVVVGSSGVGAEAGVAGAVGGVSVLGVDTGVSALLADLLSSSCAVVEIRSSTAFATKASRAWLFESSFGGSGFGGSGVGAGVGVGVTSWADGGATTTGIGGTVGVLGSVGS